MKKTARDKLIEAAEAEMLAKGYSGTTVDQICERAGVSKGSFYHFFSTKEDLGLALLDAYFERNRGIVGQAPAVDGDPRGQALAFVDHLLAVAGKLWGGGCLLGSFALDLAETNPTIADAISERFRAFAGVLAEGFAPLAEAGSGDAAALAEQFIVTVEGALILARAHHDWGYVDRALERFRKSIETTQEAAR